MLLDIGKNRALSPSFTQQSGIRRDRDHFPCFSRDLTNFVQQLMRDRGEPIPPEDSLDAARRIKELHSYTCADIVKVRPLGRCDYVSSL